jgi:hypothetical protein
LNNLDGCIDPTYRRYASVNTTSSSYSSLCYTCIIKGCYCYSRFVIISFFHSTKHLANHSLTQTIDYIITIVLYTSLYCTIPFTIHISPYFIIISSFACSNLFCTLFCVCAFAKVRFMLISILGANVVLCYE